MINVSTRATYKLKEELMQKCLDAGIGFRIMVETDENGKITSTMRFDRRQKDDMIIDLGGVTLFADATSVTRAKDYHLDFLDNPEGGFFLIKREVGAKVPG